MERFSWIIENKLAGSECPGYYADLDDDLRFLRENGISAIVSLTENAIDSNAIAKDFKYLHLPVEDFTAPAISQIEKFVSYVAGMDNRGVGVVVHCHAGLGRTGTMLAAYLVYVGKNPEDAVREIRAKRPGSIQTASQLESILHYAKKLRGEV
ncbi:MAG: hypothetical protein A7316_06865 [Candidatus Altiarchaeales archaeon WOR_SM1_86-2]|nr:MAG: hypothetical protein A7316_06865 [Candidatus Altiarchaeales archaeon WOR_SM1_86-2]ODS41638.1 MAG: hypothetical protein A7315_01040 [Candidatus Altiarchaeales archaeon WOR_SM1_79]